MPRTWAEIPREVVTYRRHDTFHEGQYVSTFELGSTKWNVQARMSECTECENRSTSYIIIIATLAVLLVMTLSTLFILEVDWIRKRLSSAWSQSWQQSPATHRITAFFKRRGGRPGSRSVSRSVWWTTASSGLRCPNHYVGHSRSSERTAPSQPTTPTRLSPVPPVKEAPQLPPKTPGLNARFRRREAVTCSDVTHYDDVRQPVAVHSTKQKTAAQLHRRRQDDTNFSCVTLLQDSSGMKLVFSEECPAPVQCPDQVTAAARQVCAMHDYENVRHKGLTVPPRVPPHRTPLSSPHTAHQTSPHTSHQTSHHSQHPTVQPPSVFHWI